MWERIRLFVLIMTFDDVLLGVLVCILQFDSYRAGLWHHSRSGFRLNGLGSVGLNSILSSGLRGMSSE